MNRFTPLLWLTFTACVSDLSSCCGQSGQPCCGVGACDDPLVCLAGTCTANQPSASKTEAELCQFLAVGQARATALDQLSAQVGLLSAAASPACGFNAAQLSAVQALQTQLVAAVAQPTTADDCDDPQSALSLQAASLAAALDAGTIAWNEPADLDCTAGMQASQSLIGLVFSDGGTFDGSFDVFGDGGGAPCNEILQGQLTRGQSCQSGLECQAGLYCQPTSDSGCGGVCAGPGDSGVFTLGTNQTAPFQALNFLVTGAVGASCDGGQICGPCLSCSLSQVCEPVGGGLSSPCREDPDCASPGLWCSDGGCQPSGLLGETCNASDPASCLIGNCVGTTCAPPGGLGDPCIEESGVSTCAAGFCDTESGLFTCVPFLGIGQSCSDSSVCAAGSFCDPSQLNCQPQLPAGGACAQDTDCLSGTCLLTDDNEGQVGVCQSPCIVPVPPGGGCSGIGVYSSDSFLLGLGGAMILGGGRKQRRQRASTRAS